ncbi:hypothetical protein BV394_16035 (plasmid) [Brevirhabdus pacifica]|uniref:Uncharacterized protein n=1 Tax=Brevirhabdus pacifica TaxID=1267768 RepID=A0A1P8QYI0_9RHOB|nr:SxtJ family membrane protein [Brevirhabdus pacifica]APX91401.1 hypothetical protein BV394_16035 [Brevirhabdus pacifica]OWU74198.1 hypothetical protein ATO5_14765 [Loktanella sp. 22II-4b]PJJ79002.1 hypothetical protein CLV77_3161 [Brevirhabdus pacifica]
MRSGASELPSDRRFGLFFAAVFALVLLWNRDGHLGPGDGLLVGLALAAAGLAWLAPARLRPLNRLWMGLGDLLGRIVSPVVLGLLYFGLITPVALAMRVAGRDELGLKPGTARKSHWKPRGSAPPEPDSFRRQF